MESKLLVKKYSKSLIQVAAMRLLPVIEEDFEQYEEETLFVDGSLPIFEVDEFYCPWYREEIRPNFPMVNKDLPKVIEPCENMPRYYPEYIDLAKDICANIFFE